MYFVYLLENRVDATWYIGYTTNIKKDIKSITKARVAQQHQESHIGKSFILNVTPTSKMLWVEKDS